MTEMQEDPCTLYNLRLLLDAYHEQALRWLDSPDVLDDDRIALLAAARYLEQGTAVVNRFADDQHPDLWAGVAGAVLAAFTVGDRLGVSASTRNFFKGKNVSKARAARRPVDDDRIQKEREVLRSFTSNRDIPKPTKFIDDNLNALKQAARAADLVPPKRTTWITRMKEIGYGSTPKKSKA